MVLRKRKVLKAEVASSLSFNRDASVRIARRGGKRWNWRDTYYWFLTLPISGVILLCSTYYILVNVLFACLYLLDPEGIAGADKGGFADAFFFSVQTIATIGYGVMYPKSLFINLVVTLETVVGIMSFALITGILFTRFSRPVARVIFSKVLVIDPHEGKPAVKFRMANERRNQILQAEVGVTLVRTEREGYGAEVRRLYDLKLVRNQSSFFGLSWTVVHIIDEASPLWGATPASLRHSETELIVLLAGVDETLSQTVHARHSYAAEDFLWARRFADILYRTPEGERGMDLDRFHETVPIG
ncbi:MAG TPA: ion channel [Alphaproteobacteria bacterium]|nr:ion channel [Alphaproteobacteria bacterium]